MTGPDPKISKLVTYATQLGAMAHPANAANKEPLRKLALKVFKPAERIGEHAMSKAFREKTKAVNIKRSDTINDLLKGHTVLVHAARPLEVVIRDAKSLTTEDKEFLALLIAERDNNAQMRDSLILEGNRVLRSFKNAPEWQQRDLSKAFETAKAHHAPRTLPDARIQDLFETWQKANDALSRQWQRYARCAFDASRLNLGYMGMISKINVKLDSGSEQKYMQITRDRLLAGLDYCARAQIHADRATQSAPRVITKNRLH